VPLLSRDQLLSHRPVGAPPLPSIALYEDHWSSGRAAAESESQPAPGRDIQPDSRRHREFTAGRRALAQAGRSLNLSLLEVPALASGAPQLPPGIIGSISHTKNYVAATVGLGGEMTTLGLDAEPWEELKSTTLNYISTAKEMQHIAALTVAQPDRPWGRILFTAKEASFKALSFLGISLGFQQTDIILGSSIITVTAQYGQTLHTLHGHWQYRAEYGTVLTVLWGNRAEVSTAVGPRS
jgi:4'-phosphopantetheinyl transferase EntD